MQEYTNTDQQIHQLCQIIAKANRSFVSSAEDDSHTNLFYDHIGGRIVGRWIDTDLGKVLLALQLESFKFVWFDTKFKEIKSYSIKGKTTVEIETAIESDLGFFKLGTKDFRDDLHFEIVSYPFKDNAFEQFNVNGLQLWRGFRDLANSASMKLLGMLQQESEIRIWPHHFDTGIYATVPNKVGIGFGLAMEDEMAGSPYFYMSAYPVSGNINYEKAAKLSVGKWINNEGWKGAILTFDELGTNSREEADRSIDRFIKETTQWYLN